jgi:copper chaperone CopZ
MNRFTSRAVRFLTPALGVALISGVASAKVVTESWQVKGVHNVADETKIKEALTKLPTVASPVVNLSSVRVTFDDEKVKESELKDAVAKAGSFELTNKIPAKPKTESKSKAESKTPAAPKTQSAAKTPMAPQTKK